MLLMKKRFFEDIRSGRKTTTLRYWRWCRVRPGSVHVVPGLGRARIESVECVRPEDLADKDARADGFENLPALMGALESLYPPEQRDGRELYHVRFTYLPSQARPS